MQPACWLLITFLIGPSPPFQLLFGARSTRMPGIDPQGSWSHSSSASYWEPFQSRPWRVGHPTWLWPPAVSSVHTPLEQVAKPPAGDGDLLFVTPSRSTKIKPWCSAVLLHSVFLYTLPPLWKRVLKLNSYSHDRLFSSVVWLEGRFETWGLWTPSSFLDRIREACELKWEKGYILIFTNL